MDERTTPDDGTLEAEHADAERGHGADRPPTAEEDEAAEEAPRDAQEEADVAEHYREMTDIGAHVKGEGEIT